MDAPIHKSVSRMLPALNSNIRIFVLKLVEKIVFGQIMLVEIYNVLTLLELNNNVRKLQLMGYNATIL